MKRFNAKSIAARIIANADDLHCDRITWEQHGERNRALWDEVAQGELNVIGSACHRRHLRVSALLTQRGGPQ